MSTVTVVIPTARRPGMLATALASVRAQVLGTPLDRVVVSENGGDPRSREVCARFADLPIVYHIQDPPLPPVNHAHHLLTLPELGERVAFLCDDDWWAPGHLATLGQALDRHPAAVGAFAAGGYIESETAVACQRYWPAVMWLRGEPGATVETQLLPGDEVLAACWVHTPFHFSSMLLRTSVLREAAAIVRDSHPAHADRLLFARLALLGPLAFAPAVSALIRRHEGNYCRSTVQREIQRAHAVVRGLVTDLAGQGGVNITAVWRRLLEPRRGTLPTDLVNLLWDYVGREPLEAAGLMPFLSRGRAHYWLKRWERWSWQVLVPWAPPILHRTYLRLRDRLARPAERRAG